MRKDNITETNIKDNILQYQNSYSKKSCNDTG